MNTPTGSDPCHMLGASDGTAAIFIVSALRNQMAPQLLNLDNPDPVG
ncbi:hypothetical protein WH367_05670 [Comamonas sp. MYb21]